MLYFIGYVLFSALVGLFGADRKWGFWGYFFSSLLFTPLLGVLFVFAADRRPEGDKHRHQP